MITYADTSALMKLYLEETHSDTVREFLDTTDKLFSSALVHLELVSAIEFAKRIRRINSPTYREQYAILERDLRAGIMTLLDISPEILQRAVPLIRIRQLKSPDAIHLATAITLNKRASHDLFFLCADRALITAARKEGLRCRDVSA